MPSSDQLPQMRSLLEPALNGIEAIDAPEYAEPSRADELRLARSRPESGPKILVVDDETTVCRLICKYLRDAGIGQPTAQEDANHALGTILAGGTDLVLLDLAMPGIGGIGVLEMLRGSGRPDLAPVIVLSGESSHQAKLQALDLGAAEFLTKPVDPSELIARVRNVLESKANRDALRDHAANLEATVRARTAELESSRRDVIRCLARASEFRDDETGQHVLRVGRYTRMIATNLGLPPSAVEMLEQAAQLHDVGKIGVPDSILLKPDRLTDDEMDVMRRHALFGRQILYQCSPVEWGQICSHTEVGADILDVGHSPILKMAARIALTHHERWDGSGYPLRLAGEDIPLEGRITSVADVFDALSTQRPYKPPLPLNRCFEILEAGRETQFDPRVLDAFFMSRDAIITTQISLADEV